MTQVYVPKKKIFQLIEKNETNSSNRMSAILYPDGHVDVGIDVFRLLDKNDFPSYPITSYRSMAEVKKVYIPCKIQRGYYMDSNLGKESYDGRNVCAG